MKTLFGLVLLCLFVSACTSAKKPATNSTTVLDPTYVDTTPTVLAPKDIPVFFPPFFPPVSSVLAELDFGGMFGGYGGRANLDFGGMYGFVQGQLSPNPATGAASCPAGYTDQTISGTNGLDYYIHYCHRLHIVGRDPVFDFGGAYGYVAGAATANPTTGAASCPAGYSAHVVSGTTGLDYPLTYCYKAHQAGTFPTWGFGGMMGYVNSGQPSPIPLTGAMSCLADLAAARHDVLGTNNVDWTVSFCLINGYPPEYANPVTGTNSCPAGYDTVPILGTANLDWPIFACVRPHVAGRDPLFDFGGMYGGGSPKNYNNPASGAMSCPSGFTASAVLGQNGLDYPAVFCYKPHQAGVFSGYHLGGFYGFGAQQNYPNPLNNTGTAALACPAGYDAEQFLGTSGLDYPAFACIH